MDDKMVFFLDPKRRRAPKFTIMNYRQDKEGLYFSIDKQLIDWTEVHNYCHSCLAPLAFDTEFDACYCIGCNEWREEACMDSDCDYCNRRPERPLDPRL